MTSLARDHAVRPRRRRSKQWKEKTVDPTRRHGLGRGALLAVALLVMLCFTLLVGGVASAQTEPYSGSTPQGGSGTSLSGGGGGTGGLAFTGKDLTLLMLVGTAAIAAGFVLLRRSRAEAGR